MKLIMGFIGFGKSTTRYHLPYVLIRNNIQVKTIYNIRRKPVLEQNYEKHNIHFTDKLHHLLQDVDVRLITICTPPSTHYEYAKKCLEYGKNVLVEKPFCTTEQEAKELLQLANQKKLMIMPFQNRRFDSDFLALKEVINEGYIGDIVEVESHLDYFRPEFHVAKGNYYDGSLYGLGVHTIDQMISLFGVPHKVFYDIRSLRNEKSPDDSFEVQLFYKKLKISIKTSHLVKIPYPRFVLHGKKGSFVKYGIDQQETCLKAGNMPDTENFGLDSIESYGLVVYIDEKGQEHEKIIPTPVGDYGKIYDNIYNVIFYNAMKLVSDVEISANIKILENGFKYELPNVILLNM
ncbi:oxidoreductase [Priestia megaterium]